MNAVTSLVQSTIGKKWIMAVSGVVMVGWLTIHTLGNYILFAGQESFNEYAHFIQSGFGIEPALLWLLRAFMLGAIGVHIWAAIALTQVNNAARPIAYASGQKTRQTSYAAKFMRLGGIVILLFLLFHLAHLTVGVFSDDALMQTTFVREDAYSNLVYGVGVPYVGAFYILANLALAAHLRHGVVSGFQTLGLNDKRWNPLKEQLGVAVPLLIAGGNIILALTVMFGKGVLIELPDPSWTPHF